MFLVLSIIALSVLILVHEFGHFIASKIAGIWVEEFGIGLPPRIIGKKIGETIYSVNLLPLGGFVRLHGETNEAQVIDTKRAFVNKGFIPRLIVILAGVFMNFVFGVVCFAIVYSFLGIPKETRDVKIIDIAAGSPALSSGLLVGDIVRRVDKIEVTSTDEFIKEVEEKKGKRIVIEVEREVEKVSSIIKITTTPRETPPEGEGPLGVAISTTQVYFPPIWLRPFVGAYYGVGQAFELSRAVLHGFGDLAGEVSKGQVPKGLVGPVGIFALLVYFFRTGILPLINFLGLISINLAVLNLIPFPPLDGSRVVTIIFEKFVGKKIVPRVEAVIHSVGMVLLILLTVFITIREVPKVISSGSITNFVETLVK